MENDHIKKATQPKKRAKGGGRKAIAGDGGGFIRRNLSLDAASLKIAASIHPLDSVAIRMALDYWEKNH